MSVLVTGAGGGIGAAIVRAAVAAGHDVIAHGRRAQTLTALVAPGVSAIAGDIADPQARAELAERVASTSLEAVIASHGMTGAIALADLTPDAVSRIMQVNAISAIELADLCADALRRTSGSFVALSSQAGLRAERENSVYCASKWALVAWARAAERDERARGYAIRTLCPGRTETDMLYEATRRIAAAQGVSLVDYEREVLAEIPLRRYATVEEIAAAALYLAAPMSASRPSLLAATGGEVPF